MLGEGELKPTEFHIGRSAKRARDDFSPAAKELLAKRVAYRCSNPRCCQATSGPQEDPNKAINIGVAAHITAASQGGPRYDPLLTPESRSATENGIWLCQICGKLVDNDPLRYTTLSLREWKRVAEAKAARALENRWTLDTDRDPGSSMIDRLPDIELRVAQFLSAHRRYCARLSYLSLGTKSFSKTLDDVYIPTRLHRKSSPSSDDEANTDEVAVSDVLLRLERQPILISGWPGSGKSTLLRHVASRTWHHPDELGMRTPYLPMLVPAYRLAGARGSLETRLRAVISDEYALEQDLPEGFMSEWSKQLEAKWLLLVDGLDQVAPHNRPQFLRWLESVAVQSDRHKILFSCRSQSTDIIRNIVAALFCEEFEVSPLDPLEAMTLATNWISTNNIDLFDEQFERISESGIRHTPLLTTMAALVFREKGSLPSRRAQLYEMFVDVSLEEARLHELHEQLNPKMCRVAKPLLAFTAFAITMDGSAALPKALASFLRDTLAFPQEDAHAAATEFLEVMAERSGIFARVGSSYDFLHPTFRQYLSAFHMVHRADNAIELLRVGLFFLWGHSAWHECIVFLGGIVSEHPEQSDAITKYLYDQCKWHHKLGIHSYKATYNLYLLAECLMDGIVVSERTRGLILRTMLNAARSARTDFSLRILLTRALASLGQVADSQVLLLSLMRDSRATHDGKAVIVGCLCEARCVGQLLEVACDRTMEVSIKRLAVSALASLQNVPALVEVFARLGPEDEVSDKAFNALFMLTPNDELAKLATAASSGEAAQVNAVLLLASFGQKSTLLSIACNNSAPIKARSASLLNLLRKDSETNALEESTDPEVRARLRAPTLALLEQFKPLCPKDVRSMDEEMRVLVAVLFRFALGERNVLLDDFSNLHTLMDEAIDRLRLET